MADENGRVTTNELWDKLDKLEQRILERMDKDYDRLDKSVSRQAERIDGLQAESRVGIVIVGLLSFVGSLFGLNLPRN